jgi:hypothetical protein
MAKYCHLPILNDISPPFFLTIKSQVLSCQPSSFLHLSPSKLIHANNPLQVFTAPSQHAMPSSTSTGASLATLPPELHIKIFSHLPTFHSIASIASTSKHLPSIWTTHTSTILTSGFLEHDTPTYTPHPPPSHSPTTNLLPLCFAIPQCGQCFGVQDSPSRRHSVIMILLFIASKA